MNITITDTFNYGLNDRIWYKCWYEGENLKSQKGYISKKKMLKYFSEKEELDEFHLLLLDNIIKTFCFVYYTEAGEFTMRLSGDKSIVIHIPQKDFENIVTNCTSD